MKQILSLARKELSSYFGSPMALIFVGVFLAATLFAFFWIDAFFARGIADVRPLFRWMPVLMIFLVAALTMRQWSEEERSGTLEMLLALPVTRTQLVLGKYLAAMALIAVALALTLFLPITVALLGPLDWGPVVGGYLAALLMASAYVAIGLFVSSRTDNQIVSLILTVLVSGLVYLIGSRNVTDFVGGGAGDLLRALGAGSRFESIERGVVDLRDLVYYVSLTALFLVLNALSLDTKRWSRGARTVAYRRSVTLTSALLALNLILMNVWLYPLNGLRLDLTAQKQYSLSPATRDLLGNLQEPLLIRGYFSEKTHPLLAPLVPQIRDLLREYEIAGGGRVALDVLDPAQDEDKEAEANQSYGIQPTPLQISGRREASVINAYFDILVRYGDQNVVLNFRDLIEVNQLRDGTVDVELRNLEYDLTRAIKRVVYGFQSVDAVLAAMNEPVQLTLFATPNSLPEELKGAPGIVQSVASDLQAKSGGKFAFQVVDPDAPNAPVTRQQLLSQYRLQPISASLFGGSSYYLDMVLKVGDKSQVLPPPDDLSEAGIRNTIESALKRSTSGFLKVAGIWTPSEQPTQNMFGQAQQPFATYQQVRAQLAQNFSVRTVDLTSGAAPSDIDVLVLIAPQDMSDSERYAVDQYLMRGGSVVVATGSFKANQDQMTGGLVLEPVENGVSDLLAHYGVNVEKSLVLDPQNEPFPVPVQRKVGGITVNEVQAINYPFFVDVRASGMDKRSPVVSTVAAVTMNWVSPLTLDAAKNQGRQVTTLLRSSPNSWVRTSTDIQPNTQQYGQLGFPVEGERGERVLAVSLQGSFESFFKGKPVPASQPAAAQPGQQPEPTPRAAAGGTVESSPDTARLVVIGSNEFLNDLVLQLSSNLSPERYLNSLQLMQNAVDWSVEDLDLLTIRARGAQTRVLAPMDDGQRSFWEFLNYGIALAALLLIGFAWNVRARNEKPLALEPVERDVRPAQREA